MNSYAHGNKANVTGRPFFTVVPFMSSPLVSLPPPSNLYIMFIVSFLFFIFFLHSVTKITFLSKMPLTSF